MGQSTPGRRIRLVAPIEGGLREDVLEFLSDRQAGNVSRETLGFYRQKLGYLLAYCEERGVTEAEAVTPQLLRGLLGELTRTHSPGGVYTIYRAVRAFWRWWAVEVGSGRNPLAHVSVPAPILQTLEPVSMDVVRALLAVCAGRGGLRLRDRCIILTLLDSGVRAAELVALNVGDLDVETGALVVRLGKGRKRRVTFVGVKARRELVRYLRGQRAGPGDPLFTTDEGGRLGYAGLRQIVRRRAAEAGIPAPSLHSFRRAFALASLRAGMDVYSLQRLLGHASLDVLRRYLAQTQSDLQEAHARAGPVDRWL